MKERKSITDLFALLSEVHCKFLRLFQRHTLIIKMVFCLKLFKRSCLGKGRVIQDSAVIIAKGVISFIMIANPLVVFVYKFFIDNSYPKLQESFFRIEAVWRQLFAVDLRYHK